VTRLATALPPKRILGAHVLLADGDAAQRGVARGLLEAEGARVDEASDGVSALRAAFDQIPPYTAVFLDLALPMLDGAAAAAALRKAGYLGPIVALSADEAARAPGCDGFVTKPFAGLSLVAAVALWFVPAAAIEPARRPAEQPADLPPLISELADEPGLWPIVQNYLDALPGVLAEAAEAIAAGDAGRLRAIAHGQAGTGGSCGYPTITDTARALDQRLRGGATIAELDAEVRAFQAECRRAVAGANSITEVTNAA
jgi:CheY-like chemotaxis protein